MAKKVLIIDDSASSMEMMYGLLHAAGYVVSCAVNGSEGIAMASAQQPDLVIIDTVLPDMNGLEVCRRVRQISPAIPCRILVITGVLDAIDAVGAKRAGADDYHVKTTDMSFLPELVKVLI